MRLNLLPRNHTRADFDLDFGDGVLEPIRLTADLLDGLLPAQVWCQRHGWEPEIPDTQSLRRAVKPTVSEG